MKVMVVAETMAPGGMEGLLARMLLLLKERGLDVGLAVMKTDMPLARDLPRPRLQSYGVGRCRAETQGQPLGRRRNVWGHPGTEALLEILEEQSGRL